LKGDPVSEQSLILKGTEGLWVLAGCSHPEVGNILEVSKGMGNVIGLAGGFHGLEDMNVLKDLDHIYPMHCTVKRDHILERFGNTAKPGGIGLQIII
jgi:7,8-dihydropterin-6-yl-methyl-4-(beta-D-ribofuranosyl)aminobenzene 5'-phosphate synthase